MGRLGEHPMVVLVHFYLQGWVGVLDQLADVWVHAVLHSQAAVRHARQDQALKQGHVERVATACLHRQVVALNLGPQLLVVTCSRGGMHLSAG